MGDVVSGKFSKKKELVWGCKGCDAQTFYLNIDGTITCRVCAVRQRAPMDWLETGLGALGEILLTEEEEEPDE